MVIGELVLRGSGLILFKYGHGESGVLERFAV